MTKESYRPTADLLATIEETAALMELVENIDSANPRMNADDLLALSRMGLREMFDRLSRVLEHCLAHDYPAFASLTAEPEQRPYENEDEAMQRHALAPDALFRRRAAPAPAVD